MRDESCTDYWELQLRDRHMTFLIPGMVADSEGVKYLGDLARIAAEVIRRLEGCRSNLDKPIVVRNFWQAGEHQFSVIQSIMV